MWLVASGFSWAQVETFPQKCFTKGVTGEERHIKESFSTDLMFSFTFITGVQESWGNWELRSLSTKVYYFGSEIFFSILERI